ncbi:hypothetical protein Trco_007745 [Trichoderma cornu-damae]|uniref:Uncharacterized protein n=1 Tax=Trichoderma cornu-damae TaxID=654480 RepID=A0A9P8TUL7_9HYPO|nr:hypothetical protein Trco_007745 [Trichoderma cornu-damae]
MQQLQIGIMEKHMRYTSHSTGMTIKVQMPIETQFSHTKVGIDHASADPTMVWMARFRQRCSHSCLNSTEQTDSKTRR